MAELACRIKTNFLSSSKGTKIEIEGVKPFAQGRIKITNLSTGNSFMSKRSINAFVDSGASNSLLPMISLAALTQAIGPLKMKPTKVITANGLKNVLQVEGVEICLDHCCYKGDVLVTDDVPGSIMLGMDFLVQSKAKIDFGYGTMFCGVNSEAVKLKFEG